MRPFIFSVLFAVVGSGLLWYQTNWQIGAASFSIGFWMVAYRH
ncbi:MAG: hypothetical protein AB1346_12740 [Thermodesulfobacteriota bacterium]